MTVTLTGLTIAFSKNVFLGVVVQYKPLRTKPKTVKGSVTVLRYCCRNEKPCMVHG